MEFCIGLDFCCTFLPRRDPGCVWLHVGSWERGVHHIIGRRECIHTSSCLVREHGEQSMPVGVLYHSRRLVE